MRFGKIVRVDLPNDIEDGEMVGYEIGYRMSADRFICNIEFDAATNSYHFADGDGDCIFTIVNCPVIVSREKPTKEEE